MFTGIKILIYFEIFSIVICENIGRKEKIKFKCNADKIESKPIPAKNFLPKPKNLKEKRKLDGDGFKDFNIYLDLLNFEEESTTYSISNNVKQMFIQGMNKAVDTLKTLLRVKPVEKNYFFLDDEIKIYSINNWNKSIIGTEMKNQNKGLLDAGIDLLIFVRFGNKSELGEYTLASAGAKYFADYTGQPLIGIANINREIDYSIGNSLEYFQSTILHEFIHILGFSDYFFKNHYHNILTKKDQNNVQRAYLNSAKLLSVAKKYFNCNEIEGIELEDFGGDGTTGSHWEERILLGDIMNGVVYPEEQVISEFTLAVLEDSGYYKAFYYTGGLMQYGKNKGCEFLNSKCVINNGEVNPKFKNEFFNNIFYYGTVDPGCSSGRQSRAYHAIFLLNNINIPEYFQYYSEPNLGGRPSTDFCPVSQENPEESENRYFVGHCSTKGNGEFGSLISYYDSNNKKKFNKNGDLTSISGESYSDHSFCVLSSLFPNNIGNSQSYSKTVNAFCYKMYCSEKSLTIQINNDFLVCPREGGKIKAIKYNGYLLCPDYYLICSGSVVCNDLFDCVSKKSLLKSDIIYDYEIQTSQDINDADSVGFSENFYELSNDGKCPLYCIQCDSQGCIKCKNDCGIVELEEGGSTKRKCMNLNDLSIGYYKNKENSIYYKCIDNCVECDNNSECKNCDFGFILLNKKCFAEIEHCENYNNDNGNCIKCEIKYKVKKEDYTCEIGSEGCEIYDFDSNTCSQCEENFRLSNINQLCYKIIENCKNYGNDELCSECNTGYALEGNNKENCKEKSFFTDEFFTKDNEITYFRCGDKDNEGVEHCNNCLYINNEVICNKCSNEYILIDEETDKCYLKEDYYNNRKYYLIDDYHKIKCSKTIQNCDECEKVVNELTCKKCIEGFRLSKNLCFEKIENCQIYGEDEKCKSCISGFAFKGEDRTICKNKNEFNEYYSKDGGISYFKCDDLENEGIQNCKACEFNKNKLICTQCKSEFILKDEETDKCYSNSDYNNNNQYYYKDEYHVRKCSLDIEHCLECEKSEGKLNCNLCENNNYLLIYEEKKECIERSLISLEEYYIENNVYYSCLYHNSVENCKKCQNQESCILCKDEYTFINDDKLLCKNIEQLGKYYIMDKNDNTIYKKCSEYMTYCDTCSSEDICLTCINKFGLYNDKKTCINITEQNHYKNKTDNLYYLCINSIINCEKCSDYNRCNKCTEGYIIINSNKSSCHLLSEINTEEYYVDPNNDNNYIKCSNYVNNCYSCQYPTGCNICNSGYIMLNENKKFCNEKEKINLTEYFSDDNMNYYSCKETKYKSDIRCFSLIPQQIITLTFLQVQMVNKQLVCYMITHSPLPKHFSLKLKINVYQNKIRNLENTQEEIILSTDDDSNGSTNSIVSFTSNREYGDDDNVQVEEIQFNRENSITSIVTENNICTLKFDNSTPLKDTKKVKLMIDEKKIPDCSTGRNVVNLSMDKIVNCEFNLNSKEQVTFSNDKLNIDFVEIKNNEKLITAECNTKEENIKLISCSINKDDNEIINNEYVFKEQIISESKQFITISSEENSFKIFCEKKESKKILLIIIIVVCFIVITLAIVLTIIICKKRYNNKLIEKKYMSYKLEKYISRNINSIRKNKTTTIGKLDTENIDEKEEEGNEVMNINKKKRRKSKSLTKKNKSNNIKKYKTENIGNKYYK